MYMNKSWWFFWVLACTVTAWAHEGEWSDWDTAVRLAREGRIVPLESVIVDARDRQPGRLLEVEFEWENGRWTYEVEILDRQGRVWELYYDAASGDLLRHEPSDD